MKIYIDNNNDMIIGKEKNNGVIIKHDNEFYKMTQKELETIYDIKNLKFEKEINDNPILCFIMISTIIFTLIMYFLNQKYVIIDSNFIIANIILLVNIFIHESGHILTLKLFNKHSKIKVGFKFYFIYPAFYVNTSDSYLLPKYKKMAVYLAGNFMNCIYILFCMIFFPELNKYNYTIISTILINFLPIIKSDGYYFTMSLFNKFNLSKSKSQNFIEDFIRGILMFIFLYILSKINFI